MSAASGLGEAWEARTRREQVLRNYEACHTNVALLVKSLPKPDVETRRTRRVVQFREEDWKLVEVALRDLEDARQKVVAAFAG